MEKMGELLARLVSDLPKMGGWPDWAVECILHRGSCKAMFYDDGGRFSGHTSFPDIRFEEEALVERIVYREMYEAALAASKPEWNGDGMPPVGCECEYKDTGTGEWVPVEIKYSSSQIVVFSGRIRFRESDVEISKDVVIDKPQFRPVRSEADKKRDEIIEALKEGLGHAHGLYDLMQIYHLLSNGKIPYIRID